MENPSQEYKKQLQEPVLEIIEVYDVFLTDGTHLRFNSSSQDLELVDFVE